MRAIAGLLDMSIAGTLGLIIGGALVLASGITLIGRGLERYCVKKSTEKDTAG